MAETSPSADIRTSPAPGSAPDHLFPDAYRRHRQGGPPSFLPPTRGWLIAVLVLGATLLVLSAPLWLRATAVARETVKQILSFAG